MANHETRSLVSVDRLIDGLSYEPQIVRAAEWVIKGKQLNGYLAEYDDLLANMQQLYGVERAVVDAALEIAENRVLWSPVDGQA